ncbi:hypothetical protein AVEN_66140-1 [Araneus ventricosus]|uniref:Uncharacterized protein n=1 Tax=Araneus ventricosus TaxID=182803 RepID=A0A4Y2HHZ1_ARAVE|nr:hypothetical protein AVEN_66140-1 [Araneus ventricosus]
MLKSIHQILSQTPDVLSKRVYTDKYPPDTFPKTEVVVPKALNTRDVFRALVVPTDHLSFSPNSNQILVFCLHSHSTTLPPNVKLSVLRGVSFM